MASSSSILHHYLMTRCSWGPAISPNIVCTCNSHGVTPNNTTLRSAPVLKPQEAQTIHLLMQGSGKIYGTGEGRKASDLNRPAVLDSESPYLSYGETKTPRPDGLMEHELDFGQPICEDGVSSEGQDHIEKFPPSAMRSLGLSLSLWLARVVLRHGISSSAKGCKTLQGSGPEGLCKTQAAFARKREEASHQPRQHDWNARSNAIRRAVLPEDWGSETVQLLEKRGSLRTRGPLMTYDLHQHIVNKRIK